LEAFQACPNADTCVKVGTAVAHKLDAQTGDVVVMGASTDTSCCTLADEEVDGERMKWTTAEFPYHPGLEVMQAEGGLQLEVRSKFSSIHSSNTKDI